jgi:hypothetical protein
VSIHKVISFVKSTIRLLGYFVFWMAFLDNPTAFLAFIILTVSEMLGVIEKVEEK